MPSSLGEWEGCLTDESDKAVGILCYKDEALSLIRLTNNKVVNPHGLDVAYATVWDSAAAMPDDCPVAIIAGEWQHVLVLPSIVMPGSTVIHIAHPHIRISRRSGVWY